MLPELGLSVTAFAATVHTSRQTAHHILAEERGITPEMALKIGRFCGNSACVWLRMQQAFDQDMAEKRLGAELQEIEQAVAE